MEIITVDIRNEQEKKALLFFLDNLGYHYTTESDGTLTNDQFGEMLKRKAGFLAGKTTSRPWQEIKNSYQQP